MQSGWGASLSSHACSTPAARDWQGCHFPLSQELLQQHRMLVWVVTCVQELQPSSGSSFLGLIHFIFPEAPGGFPFPFLIAYYFSGRTSSQ